MLETRKKDIGKKEVFKKLRMGLTEKTPRRTKRIFLDEERARQKAREWRSSGEKEGFSEVKEIIPRWRKMVLKSRRLSQPIDGWNNSITTIRIFLYISI